MSLAEELRTVIQGDVDDTTATRETYSRDASLFSVTPEVVVYPRDTADVQALVRFVAAQKELGRPLSLTARGAGTDMSGGPLSDSIVVDMTKYFTRIHEVGRDGRGGYAVVDPGVYFRDFDRETQKQGLELPSYTASRDLCTVGGMVANDSGGERHLKYGKTARYVESLEMVLADGEVYTLTNLVGGALESMRGTPSFGGNVHRAVGELVAEHREVIASARPRVLKNSSGYALWDIGDGVSSLNLARLVVGSQGTFGIITRITFRLVEPLPKSAMLVVFVNDIAELAGLVPRILAHQPDAFESYDDHTFALATKYFPEFALQMRANLLSLGISFLPEVWRLLTNGVPKLVLLVEFRSHTQSGALRRAKALREELHTSGRPLGLFLARDERAARKYWVVRHESFNLLRKKVRGLRTAPFIEDFVVPPETLPEFLPKLNAILAEYDLTYTIAGHVGDGNFHIIPLIDPKRPDGEALVRELSSLVYDLVLSYHGSISGEHNDGYVRTPYVERMFGPEMTDLFERVEALMDPQDIFNPGKKVVRGDVDPFQYLDLPHA